MRFGILGPVTAWDNDVELPLGGWRPRALLARLLLHPGEVVPSRELIRAFYDSELPESVGSTPKTAAKLLRQALAGQRGLIETRPSGYRIAVQPELVDAGEFRALVRTADRQDPAEACRTLERALRLWRGPALADLGGTVFRAAAAQWDEMRLVALERKITAGLALGHHQDLIGELYELIDNHAQRETPRGLLMRALVRSGRTSEALEVYSDYRDHVREQFGIEPSPQLSQLQIRILNMDPDLLGIPSQRSPVSTQSPGWGDNTDTNTAPPVSSVLAPDNLPARPHGMIGRSEQLALIQRALTAHDRSHLPIVVISGPGGYGKTTLAIEAAHRLADDYPGGRLYAYLSGAQPHPASAGDVLARFLAFLGVTEVPTALEAKAEVFRAAVTGKRVLIVLDDASLSTQVLPLLPGDPDCAVLVTSRAPMAGMRGDHIILGPMSQREAHTLITDRVGDERTAGPDNDTDLRRLIRLCSGMPLALDLACARLATHPHWDLMHLADRLEDINRRLTVLEIDGRDVRNCFELGYQFLSPAAQALMQALGHLGANEVSDWTAAALADSTIGHVVNLLDELAEAHLLTVTGTAPNFHGRIHDLVLAYARERALSDGDPDDLLAALNRALGAQLALMDAAYATMHGPLERALAGSTPRWSPNDASMEIDGSAAEWFASRLPHIAQMVQRAAEVGLGEGCWELAAAPQAGLETAGYFDLWHRSHTIALAAVRKADIPEGEATLLHSLGYRALVLRNYVEAGNYLRHSAKLFSNLGHIEGQAAAMVLLSGAHRLRGDHLAAQLACKRGFALKPANERTLGELWMDLGRCQTFLNQPAEATEALRQSLDLFERSKDMCGQAKVHYDLAQNFVRRADLEAAASAFRSALRIAATIGDTLGMAYILTGLGETHARLCNSDDAYPLLFEAMDLAEQANNLHVQSRALRAVADLHLEHGLEGLAKRDLQAAERSESRRQRAGSIPNSESDQRAEGKHYRS
ncbi:AfsR/SARP family transcriptional regulator [Actinomadura harenae]|uniref:AfsR/SARP family transcriptional regulator n=1 Tax=Actinomadura harenae TaxID=2483351 RepID=UPI0013150E18|nr:BTAD domain-containing putative transcriptional regulator [Actinomadura harenae]